MQTKCLFCGNTVQLILVHGHYQCPVCKTNGLPCCDGDNCNNFFLNELPSASMPKEEEKNTSPRNRNA